jgi:SAM-dependent methyltransferase
MTMDAGTASSFYATAQGAVAALLLRERLSLMWPKLTGRSILGLGYAAPYLRLWREGAERCVALTPAQVGAIRWPAGQPGLSCTADEDRMPFQDSVFDHVLLVHGLEMAENRRALLREIWRVLRDSGRLIVVAPNRHGLWAHAESTPFGHGQPFSARQVDNILAEQLFRTERKDTALFIPPSTWRPVLRAGRMWEQTGRAIAPQLAGVTITEAVKDVNAAMPLRASRRRLVWAEAA